MRMWYQENIDVAYRISEEERGGTYYGFRFDDILTKNNGIYTLTESDKDSIIYGVKNRMRVSIGDFHNSLFKAGNYSLLESPCSPNEIASQKYGKNFKKRHKDANIINEMIDKVDRELLIKLLAIANKKNPVNDVYVNWYLKKWATSKYEYYQLLGNCFKASKQVDVKMSMDEIRRKIAGIARKYPSEKTLILSKISHEEWLANRISPDSLLTKDKKCVGMKVSKYLSKKFQDAQFDIDISRIFQDMRKTGNIVISIDPIDYLTVSIVDSTHGWFSCYRITPGSGWANCGPAMMIDESSVIMYRDNGTIYDYDIEGIKFSWNSKQIRWIVLIDKNTSSVIFTTPMGSPSNDFMLEMEKFLTETFWKDLNIIYREDSAPRLNIKRKNGYHHLGDDFAKIMIPYQLARKHVKFEIGNRRLICPSNGRIISFSHKDNLFIEEGEK